MFVNPGLSVLIISVQFAYSISNRFQNIGYENKRHRLTAFVPVLTKKVWNIQEYNAGCHLVEIKNALTGAQHKEGLDMTMYSPATQAMVSDASTNPPFLRERRICFISIYLIKFDWTVRFLASFAFIRNWSTSP
ncbi:hypothetical protein BK141_15490 [Paenibacillus sp. FSL R5-0765]|nr:hypothetical protein BK141_15490 [Paenibacillus sp. FSL R5-0765]